MLFRKTLLVYTALVLALLMVAARPWAQGEKMSMAGVYVGALQQKVERLAGKSIHVNNDFTPVSVIIGGVPFDIIFHTFLDSTRHVYRISTTSSRFRTTAGVGVGNSVQKVWHAYKEYKYLIRSKVFYSGHDLSEDSKFSFSIYIGSQSDIEYDDQLDFYFDNLSGKVIEVSLRHGEDWP